MAYTLVEKWISDAGNKFAGNAQGEQISCGYRKKDINQANLKDNLTYAVKQAAAQHGYILLSIEHHYEDTPDEHHFKTVATYTVAEHKAAAMSTCNNRCIKSMQFELIPIFDLVAIVVATLILATALYFVLDKVDTFLYGPGKGEPCTGIACGTSGKLTITSLAIAALIVYLVYQKKI